MTHIELESWIAKTLILLKSPSEESAEELRTMLVETIHQKYNGRKQFKAIPPITGCEYSNKTKVGDIYYLLLHTFYYYIIIWNHF